MGTDGGDRLEGLVLAAGQGSRFGGRKLTRPFGEGVLLDGALAAAFTAPVRAVTVVTGADQGVAAAAERFCEARGEAARLRIVHAPDHAEGLAASLRAGIGSLPADAEGCFVFLGDMPRVPSGVLGSLAAALPGRLAAVPVFGGRRGHPALFARALFPKLLALSGDVGARAILERLGPALALVESPDDGVLFDVDESGDLATKKPGSPLSRG
jgi:molybdenum cofactor cytidylyltransferase